MTPQWRGSLRQKLRASMLLTTWVSLVVAISAMVVYDLKVSHEGWVTELQAQTELLGSTTAPALAFDDARVATENLALLRFQPRVRAAAIYNARGGLFATYSADRSSVSFPPLPGGDGIFVEQRNQIAFHRIVENGQILGTVYLLADYPLYGRVLSYTGIALLVAAVGMLVALLMSSWLQKVITGPILAIGTAAREVVAQRDYSRRVDKRSDDELGTLVDAFNNMMREIERRTQALETANREQEHEVAERREAEREVLHLNAELEHRVRERTAQLERTNSELALATVAAEEANRAKSAFLSNMSHELRTPLNAIIGFGQLLEAGDALPPERRRAFVGHIVTAGHHLLALINDILNLAQIEAGKVSLSLEVVALDDVLEECRTMTEPLAEGRSVRLIFPARDGQGVQADRTRLKQVLLNLLSNAVKYNREGGSVVVACSRPAAERLRIAVQDTGQGMRPDQLALMFQPFNRLGQESGLQQGTGIGLVVTQHLVELMGGEMGVSSTPGVGSVFWVELNASGAPVGEAARKQAPAPDAERMAVGDGAPLPRVCTVLCVEDNPASLQLIEETLASRPNLRLLTATDGQAGIQMARTHRPDVILMDNNMPVLSGSEAQAILRNDPATAGIPIIAISANAMPGAIAQGLAAGFFRYLTKPINLPELLVAVDSALEVAAERKKG